MYLIGKDLWDIVTDAEILSEEEPLIKRNNSRNVRMFLLLPYVCPYQPVCKFTYDQLQPDKKLGITLRNISSKRRYRVKCS